MAVFGVSLETAVQRSQLGTDGVELPTVFREFIDFLEEHGESDCLSLIHQSYLIPQVTPYLTVPNQSHNSNIRIMWGLSQLAQSLVSASAIICGISTKLYNALFLDMSCDRANTFYCMVTTLGVHISQPPLQYNVHIRCGCVHSGAFILPLEAPVVWGQPDSLPPPPYLEILNHCVSVLHSIYNTTL